MTESGDGGVDLRETCEAPAARPEPNVDRLVAALRRGALDREPSSCGARRVVFLRSALFLVGRHSKRLPGVFRVERIESSYAPDVERLLAAVKDRAGRRREVAGPEWDRGRRHRDAGPQQR